MPTDLTTVQDHPAAILQTLRETLPHLSIEIPGVIRAREVLRAHEHLKDVTFATLDNDALAEVRREYARYVNGDTHALGAAIDLLLDLES